MSTNEQALRALLQECVDFFENCPSYDGADTGNLHTRCVDALTAEQPQSDVQRDADEYEFVVYEGDMSAEFLSVAASGTSSDLEEVKQEAAHYAAMYAQDGPVTVELYAIKRTKIASDIGKERT